MSAKRATPCPAGDGPLSAELPGLACAEADGLGQILAWSAGMAEIFGWTSEEMIGCQTPDCLPRTLWNTDRPAQSEITALAKDGRSLALRVWSTPLTGTDGSLRHFIVVVDESEKKFLEQALLEAAEREQRRIGQELHDHLCQHLLGAAFSAKALAGDLDRENSPHAAELHDLARLINDAVTQVRDVSRGLQPVEFDAAGLMSALQELAARTSHSVACTFSCESPVYVRDPAISLHAYRIAQEAVADALHARGAAKIEILLAAHASSVVLTVQADGANQGELTANPQGTAAKTLSYRARAMRGEIAFHHKRGHGTKIVCKFPKKP